MAEKGKHGLIDYAFMHGRVSTYNYYGCRCDKCKAASRVYHQRKYEAAKSRRGKPNTASS